MLTARPARLSAPARRAAPQRRCLAVVAAGNIVETATAAGKFGTLLKAAAAAGLVDALTLQGNVTVFAPTVRRSSGPAPPPGARGAEAGGRIGVAARRGAGPTARAGAPRAAAGTVVREPLTLYPPPRRTTPSRRCPPAPWTTC